MTNSKNELNIIKNEILNLSEKYFNLVNKNRYFVPGVSKIPVSGKVLSVEDLQNLIISSLDMWLTAGDFTDEFESSISKYLGMRHALFVNSGSSANLLAISALKKFYNLENKDEVITSAVNFPTTVNPIIQNNLTPVFVDAEFGTYNIDVNQIEKAITKRTKGIVLAHTLGNPFNLKEISEICKKYNLFLMEDMCDAFGSKYDGKYVGSYGDVATLSFYPAHHITTGEGGAVVTNNTKLRKIMLSMRDWGRDCYCKPGEDNTCKKRFEWQLGGLPSGYDHKYIYSHIGFNLKASDMQAAIGVSQISKLDSFIKSRKENFDYLFKNFSKFEVFDMPVWDKRSTPSWFGFPLLINNKAKFSRKNLLEYYEINNIGTRLLFAGNILLQPAYYKNFTQSENLFPNANKIAENAFWLGVYPGLDIEMLDYVISKTELYLEENK